MKSLSMTAIQWSKRSDDRESITPIDWLDQNTGQISVLGQLTVNRKSSMQ